MNSTRSSDDRTAAWLVGDRLACVLHLGDSTLAYRLADQGHEVVIAGDDAVIRRHPDVAYVRCQGYRLPFVADSFDAVVAPHLDESPTVLAEYARVLRAGGLLSTVVRQHDATIPWVRKLHELVGRRPAPAATPVAVAASGLFDEPEVDAIAEWQELDLAGVLRFAHEIGDPTRTDDPAAQVHALYGSYRSHAGFLRLRHETIGIRAAVVKDALAADPDPAATPLFDFA